MNFKGFLSIPCIRINGIQSPCASKHYTDLFNHNNLKYIRFSDFNKWNQLHCGRTSACFRSGEDLLPLICVWVGDRTPAAYSSRPVPWNVDQIKCSLSQDIFKVITSVVTCHHFHHKSVGQKVTHIFRGQHSAACSWLVFQWKLCFLLRNKYKKVEFYKLRFWHKYMNVTVWKNKSLNEIIVKTLYHTADFCHNYVSKFCTWLHGCYEGLQGCSDHLQFWNEEKQSVCHE